MLIKLLGGACLACAVLAVACRREQRRFTEPPPASRLNADPQLAPTKDRESLVLYSENAWAISEGQRLFSQMNCAGCHSKGGGGGMGPPLMDAAWRYGSGLADIERSILGGRPNGMPAFAGRVSPQQAWQLVAYVRSLSGHAPSPAAPVRDDHMAVRPPPSRTDPQPPTREKVEP
jgi:cytochrome c oxidase cbb3-type subunit III